MPGQQRLFAEVWTTHVKAQLEQLNQRLAPASRQLGHIAGIGPTRTAATLAAAWMRHPDRLVRMVDPEPDAAANRSAVQIVLFLVSGELTGLHADLATTWHVLVNGLQASIAAKLRAAPLSGWNAVQFGVRHYGLPDPDGQARAEFLEQAKARGLAVEATPSKPEVRPWYPTRSIRNWFGPGARMPNRPTQEKRHAVVDAYFHDEYWLLDPTVDCPVRLLDTFPAADLVDPPADGLPIAEYERECRLRDIAWHQAFVEALAGYDEVEVAWAELRAREDDLRAQASPPVSAHPPRPPALAAFQDYLSGFELPEPELRAACARALACLSESAAAETSAVARAVLGWCAGGQPDAFRSALADKLGLLSAQERYSVLVLCHDAVAALLEENKQ